MCSVEIFAPVPEAAQLLHAGKNTGRPANLVLGSRQVLVNVHGL